VPDDTATDEADAEILYRWTIRALYVLAIGLNVYMLIDQMKDSPEVAVTRARVEGWLARRLAPLKATQAFRRHANAVIYEATEIVENA
jgi:hypothetical protein